MINAFSSLRFHSSSVLINVQLSEQKADSDQEREDMEEVVKELSREVRLQQLVIDTYIPDQYQQLIHSHATWNEDTGEWHLVSILLPATCDNVVH